MKKRAFFLTSLPLALAALAVQASGFYFILLAIAEATGRLMWMLHVPPFIFTSQAPPERTGSFGAVARVLLLSGMALAVLSLVCVIASFWRRESGWRFISVTLLTVYLGTWLALIYG